MFYENSTFVFGIIVVVVFLFLILMVFQCNQRCTRLETQLRYCVTKSWCRSFYHEMYNPTSDSDLDEMLYSRRRNNTNTNTKTDED